MNGAPQYWFDHEKLEVYREAIAFVAWLSGHLEGPVRIGDVKFAARVPPGFSIPDAQAGLKFDPSRVHVYADSRLVEGVA